MTGKFARILVDYSYFKDKAAMERKLDDHSALHKLDDELRNVRSLFARHAYRSTALLDVIHEAGALPHLSKLYLQDLHLCKLKTCTLPE